MSLKIYSKYSFIIITSLLLTTTSFAFSSFGKSSVKFLNGSNVPGKVIFYDEEKNPYSLVQFEEKTILLVFWATWCGACTKEMPDLDILQNDFRKLPFAVIPVSQDDQGIEVIKKYYKDYQISYLPIYHDYKNQLFKAFSIVGIPTSILISPEGKKIAKFVGNTNWHDEEIRKIILSNIPGNYPEPKNSYEEASLNQSPKPSKHTNSKAKNQSKAEKSTNDKNEQDNE
ncbi:TlpA family protein disulfide reductase [Rickettsia endosymbiont of Halotydeus destructor]|uniref:TlpA family protein disulfide reductase n=1 Tax=Rickettsia endosymbiont of Halotydeus destructor TaxID=2996754 RepID=UPI003BAF0CCF